MAAFIRLPISLVLSILAGCGPTALEGSPVDFSVLAEGEVEVQDGFGFDNGCWVGLVEMVTSSRPITDIFEDYLTGEAPPSPVADEYTWVLFNDRCSSGGRSLVVSDVSVAEDFLFVDSRLVENPPGPDSTYRQYVVFSTPTSSVDSLQGVVATVIPDHGE